jgi:hypothetical protein
MTQSIKRQDFILDENGDFPLEDTIINDIYLPTPYGNSDNQHKTDCILYNKGALKQFPTSGFGVTIYLESEYDADNVYSNLSEQMKNDGYSLSNKAVYPVANGGFNIETDLIQSIY